MKTLRIFVALAVVLSIGTISGIAYGEQRAIKNYQGFVSPDVFVNGKIVEIKNSETPPIIMNNRTLIPLRAVAESLGLRVGFSYEDMKVTVDGQCAPPESK